VQLPAVQSKIFIIRACSGTLASCNACGATCGAACHRCVGRAGLKMTRFRAGTWKGLEVAIKTVVFEGGPGGSAAPPAAAASEAAIASNLVHGNLVATYAHRQRTLVGGDANELRVLKLYLIQARFDTCAAPGAGHCPSSWTPAWLAMAC
jgi:hypothetical protein